MSLPHVKVIHSVPVKPSSNATRVVMMPMRVYALFHSRESIRPVAWAPTLRRLIQLVEEKHAYNQKRKQANAWRFKQ